MGKEETFVGAKGYLEDEENRKAKDKVLGVSSVLL